MLEAVLFDLDGVLVETADASTAFFRELLPRAGLPAPTLSDLDGVWALTMVELLERLIPDDPTAVSRVLDLAHTLDYPIHLAYPCPGAQQVFRQVGARYKTAVVTGRIRRDAVKLLAKVGIQVDLLIAREDYEHPKPDPEPLLICLERLHVRPEHSVYVGDAPSDVAAAKAAGMRSVLLAPEDARGADARIAELRALIPALGGLQ